MLKDSIKERERVANLERVMDKSRNMDKDALIRNAMNDYKDAQNIMAASMADITADAHSGAGTPMPGMWPHPVQGRYLNLFGHLYDEHGVPYSIWIDLVDGHWIEVRDWVAGDDVQPIIDAFQGGPELPTIIAKIKVDRLDLTGK